MKKLSLIFALLATFIATQAQERPKIAVVLAGGGAKGVAHIQALKTIEEAGIPIDLVVGTSMGSIIGGMYCVGYSPDSMTTIVGKNDWVKLIIDNPDYGNNRITARMNDENYILRMSINHEDRSASGGKAGVIQGRNVMKFFRSLTDHLPDSIDFADLPVPFACVATNAFNGAAKVFTSGNLPRCIRASMAIPTVFTPMHIDGSSYIDGGIADNFPVDVARQLGADIVIGVNLIIPTNEEKLTSSAVDILMNVFDLNSQSLYHKNIQDADIYIPIDVTGFSAASFTKEAMDTLMVRGKYYSQLKKQELIALHDSLHLDEPVHRTRIGEYAFAHTDGAHRLNKSLHSMKENYLNSAINIGARFDSDEFASIIASGKFLIHHKSSTLLDTKIRLGQRIGFGLDLSTKSIGSQRIGTYYNLMHRDLTYYYDGEKAGQVASFWHNMGIYSNQEFRKVMYSFGLDYDIHAYDNILSSKLIQDMKDTELDYEHYFTYYIDLDYNSLNRQYFATRGSQIYTMGELVSSNLYSYDGHSMIPILTFFCQTAIPFGSRFAIRPHLSTRQIFNGANGIPLFAIHNIVGGYHRSMQVEQQMTMAGLPHMELIQYQKIGIAGLTMQQQFFKNHFACLRFDASSMFNDFAKIGEENEFNWGLQGSYSVRTGIGPITIMLGYNTMTSGLQATFNAGYCF